MTLKRKDDAVQMPTKPCPDPISSAAVESDVIIQKLLSVCAPSDIKDAFRYDLAHVSPSLLLDDGNLRPIKRFTEIPVELLGLTVQEAVERRRFNKIRFDPPSLRNTNSLR